MSLFRKLGFHEGAGFVHKIWESGGDVAFISSFFPVIFSKKVQGFSLNFRKKNCSYDFNNRGHQISTSVVRYFMYNGQLQEFSNFSDRKVNAYVLMYAFGGAQCIPIIENKILALKS
uniref:Uncharacterized protein n=1 Tax=Cacopsylla melanoneura TaxID=428564 RepID=A0A8D8R2Q8_9HEMI